MTKQTIKDCFLRLLSSYPLYSQSWRVHVQSLGVDGWWSVSLDSGEMPHTAIPRSSTYVDINIENDVFYLLHIELDKKHRGQGYGESLYKICEDAAASLGCKTIKQTPSGWTATGDSRLQYLLKRSWQLCKVPGGVVVYKDLTCSNPSTSATSNATNG